MPSAHPLRIRWYLLAGFGLSIAAAAAAWRQENVAARELFARRGQQLLSTASDLLQRGMLVLELLGAFHRASDRVDAHELVQFCQPILAGGPPIEWIAWCPAGGGDGGLVVLPPANAARAHDALQHHDATAQRPSAHLADRDGQPLLLLRSHAEVAERSDSNQRGDLVVALRLREVLERSRRFRPDFDIALLIAPPDATTPAVHLASPLTPDGPLPADWRQRVADGETQPFRVHGLTLELAAFPGNEIEADHTLAICLLVAGVLTSLTVAWRLDHESSTRRRVERLVELRTRELHEANTELERRVAERTRDLAEANREMEAFNYSVSHDLRAPLRAIDGFAGILAEDYGASLPDDAQRLLGVVRSSCADMSRLIDALLRLSRLGRQALAPTRVDVTQQVREVVAELQTDTDGARTTFDIGELGTLHADPVLLREVFRNLLGNGAKFSRRRPDPRVTVRRSDHADGVTISVADNGVGFESKYADKLFAPFQRLHRADEFEGTGIGLALCQRILTRHGGRIDATAAPGEGATFRLHFPDAREP